MMFLYRNSKLLLLNTLPLSYFVCLVAATCSVALYSWNNIGKLRWRSLLEIVWK